MFSTSVCMCVCRCVCSHPSSIVTPCMTMELATLTFSFTVVELPIVDLFMEVLSAIWHRAPIILSDPVCEQNTNTNTTQKYTHSAKTEWHGTYFWLRKLLNLFFQTPSLKRNFKKKGSDVWIGCTWHFSEMTADGWTAGSSNSFGA